jgi:peptide/nickel transport system substrate-binding protein
MQNSPMLSALCHPWVTACEHSLSPPPHDPAAARRLLAEAGLAQGFDLTLGATTTTKSVAEAIAGQLRAVGIRASVDAQTIGVWLKRRAEGKLETTVTMWDNAGGAPDVEWTTNFFFLGDSSDYFQDRVLNDWTLEGAVTMDTDARRAVYRKLFDHVTTEHYAIPVMELPAIIVHHRDLMFEGGHKKPEGFEFHRIRWTN